jgi:hypothetical protein
MRPQQLTLILSGDVTREKLEDFSRYQRVSLIWATKFVHFCQFFIILTYFEPP